MLVCLAGKPTQTGVKGVRFPAHLAKGSTGSKKEQDKEEADMLKGAGVVLCTYNHSAALKSVGEGLKFDLIVLDEASQVAETLTLVPLMCMGSSFRLVLAGNHWPDLHGLFTKMRARAMVVFLSRNKRMPRNLTLPRKLS